MSLWFFLLPSLFWRALAFFFLSRFLPLYLSLVAPSLSLPPPFSGAVPLPPPLLFRSLSLSLSCSFFLLFLSLSLSRARSFSLSRALSLSLSPVLCRRYKRHANEGEQQRRHRGPSVPSTTSIIFESRVCSCLLFYSLCRVGRHMHSHIPGKRKKEKVTKSHESYSPHAPSNLWSPMPPRPRRVARGLQASRREPMLRYPSPKLHVDRCMRGLLEHHPF